jgi:hypothetical protein
MIHNTIDYILLIKPILHPTSVVLIKLLANFSPSVISVAFMEVGLVVSTVGAFRNRPLSGGGPGPLPQRTVAAVSGAARGTGKFGPAARIGKI